MKLLKYIKYRICILLVDKLWPKKYYSCKYEEEKYKIWDKCCEYSYKYEEDNYKYEEDNYKI